MKISTPKKFIFIALAVFAMAALVMVVVYFIKKKKATNKADKEAAKKEAEVLDKYNGSLPPVVINVPATNPAGNGSDTGSTQPTGPVLVPEIPAYIKKLCWVSNEISKTGGTSEYRCEVCNNLKTLGNYDIALWAETYRIWYGTSLKADLSKDFVDCGCIFWTFSGCSCTKPNFDRLS